MFTLQNQTFVFLASCVLGFFLGMVYDAFRISRLAFKLNAVVVFIEDVLFFVIAAVSSFAFMLLENNGVLRGFLLIGEIVGAILYFSTLSLLIMKLASVIINAIKCILRVVYKILISPIVKLFMVIIRLIKRILSRLRSKIKRKDHSNDIYSVNIKDVEQEPLGEYYCDMS